MSNATIEALCDFVETEANQKIAAIKDISATAVGVSIVVWAVVFLAQRGKIIGSGKPLDLFEIARLI